MIEPKIVQVEKDYIVVEKPAGILVHPTQAGEKDTLIDFVLKKYKEIKKVGDSPERPGIAHRLDKEASGLLVIARTQEIRAHMFAFNHPVVGDTLYLNRKLVKKNQQKLDRLFLHSAKLCFGDLAGEKKCFESGLPEELKGYLKDIGYRRILTNIDEYLTNL